MARAQYLSFVFLTLLARLCLVLSHSSDRHDAQFPLDDLTTSSNNTVDSVPLSVREYWMREAMTALLLTGSPCPFEAFGSVVVNHTVPGKDGLGELVCIGANNISATGNPTLHGEVNTITNCTRVLTDSDGSYKLSPAAALAAFSDLSLYTTAEACPMCASAIRWGRFREYIYASSISFLIEKGWNQINLPSKDVFAASTGIPGHTNIIAGILTDETDPLFSWQFDTAYPCPKGCARTEDGGGCERA